MQRREPIGVVGVIVPWNAPQGLLAVRIAPALAAGCTVVVKPSPETSLDAYILGEMIAAAQFPPGVVNIVTGGRQTGAALVAHRGTDKISFTGSVATGRAIATTCGAQLKPVSAELGGKSAVVLLADADLEQFGRSVVRSSRRSSSTYGPGCASTRKRSSGQCWSSSPSPMTRRRWPW